MITSLKDGKGRIIAYCEWRLVGPSGYEMENGQYVWVNDCWVHSSYRYDHRINHLIDEVMQIVPSAKYCYFQRKNKNGKLRIFTHSQMERRRMVYERKVAV